MRTLQVISPRRTPSRSRLANIILRVYSGAAVEPAEAVRLRLKLPCQRREVKVERLVHELIAVKVEDAGEQDVHLLTARGNTCPFLVFRVEGSLDGYS